MLIIAAFLGIQDPRERPADQRAAADNAHALFADPKSRVRRHPQTVGGLSHRARRPDAVEAAHLVRKHFLSFLRLREWRELHRQLKLLVRRTPLDAERPKEAPLRRRCIAPR
jgi:ATP-dependent helicase HrpA